MTKQFTMSMYATKEELYKDKAEYYEQKLDSLIAELEGLQRYDICNGKYIFYADIEALIDKCKGGEVDGLSQCSRTT